MNATAVLATAVLTIVAGRHDHLRGQLIGLQRSTSTPRWHVVAAMGDPAVGEVVAEFDRPGTCEVVVVDVPVGPDGELPLARARNAAAAEAVRRGAELLVLLDVDCVPAPGTLAAYERAVARGAADAGPALWCGTVAYLPPGVVVRSVRDLEGLSAAADPHPARPVPAAGEVVLADESQWWLFWSLSFATTAADWRRFGGFCEEFRGYGGEDTDVAATVRSMGGALHWVGGAQAYHQHHPTQRPPVQHLEAVLRNAAVFHRRWGWFPMEGWLAEFQERGLAAYDAATSTWSSTRPSTRPSVVSDQRPSTLA
ncbi:galactosyltransferase-related protein [Kineococcus sp. NBC_00420]|uniref:glycosyltransferase family 2 protein n=1 Tax=Kineococcus sp. NBC_00420 TaxID=2903564 RepID=UPI002E1A1AED